MDGQAHTHTVSHTRKPERNNSNPNIINTINPKLKSKDVEVIREVNLHVTVTEHTSYENERIKYNATYIWIKSDGSPVPLSKSGNWAGPDDSGDISFSVWLGEGHEDLVFPQHHLHTSFFWHAVVTDSMRSTFLQVLHVKRHRKWFQIWLVRHGEAQHATPVATVCAGCSAVFM